MQELIQKIDDLIKHIKSDTNRTKLPDLNECLIKLSINLWEAKKEKVRLKSKIEAEEITKAEQRSQYLNKQYRDEYQKTLDETVDEKEKKKIKLQKPSNVEIKDMTALDMLNFTEEGKFVREMYAEAQMTIDYLEPIIKAYYERINSIKFIDKIQL